ncbi:2-hydroxy-3-oxopropionate reductase [Rugosimonospora acidiphila]|uniref:2-hydroxy-3-oxopropionate reductase n=1 Tax=Rugosimonospora acidiphila TaxID=556531 RepID=A0ABP9SK80_9ACTN
MTVVGFIGLGIMGRPMAVNLVKAGFDVIGYSRRPESAGDLVAAGGRAAGSIAEVAAAAEVVVLMVPDSPDVEQVVLGADGLLAHARAGQLLIDMSTVTPQTETAVAKAAAAKGVRTLDAPVSGGEKGAIDGTLSIMVGGAAEDFATARPVFEAVGKTIEHVGPTGAGQIVKAANQLLVGGIIELVSEALLLVEASGVDPDAAVRVLAGGLAGNRVLDLKAANMLARQFQPGFRIDLHHKDLGIVLAAARDAGLSLPVTAVVAQLFVAARAQGLGSLDHSGLLKVVEGLSSTR